MILKGEAFRIYRAVATIASGPDGTCIEKMFCHLVEQRQFGFNRCNTYGIELFVEYKGMEICYSMSSIDNYATCYLGRFATPFDTEYYNRLKNLIDRDEKIKTLLDEKDSH
jgi:hypothetical protein